MFYICAIDLYCTYNLLIMINHLVAHGKVTDDGFLSLGRLWQDLWTLRRCFIKECEASLIVNYIEVAITFRRQHWEKNIWKLGR